MGLITQTEQAYYTGSDFGGYQFTSLEHVINQFIIAYVGESKIISKIKRTDVAYHAQRALQELSFDTFKSTKSQEIVVPASLTMVLPQDYVNYIKLTWSDSSGVEHIIYPAIKTSNPTSIQQKTVDAFNLGQTKGDYSFDTGDVDGDGITTELLPQYESSIVASTVLNSSTTATLSAVNSNIVPGMIVSGSGITAGTTVTAIVTLTGVITLSAAATANATNSLTFTLANPQSTTNANFSTLSSSTSQDDYDDDTYWPANGGRYGLDPQHSQVNGSFFIDELTGKIHFSSNISGKTVILKYISDSLGTDAEMKVHKFAEEAMYKYMAYAILSTSSSQMHQQLAPRFKKERFAETRKAKLRLSNIKLEEITQILRGKSKQIKH